MHDDNVNKISTIKSKLVCYYIHSRNRTFDRKLNKSSKHGLRGGQQFQQTETNISIKILLLQQMLANTKPP